MTSKGIPKSRAKTAYGLLSEVRALILAEPKRYHQGIFIDRKGARGDAQYVQQYPACGTVGCVAGWVATLKHPKRFGWSDTAGIAGDILGLHQEQADELFSGGAVRASLGPQTERYAKAGAKHIANFQRKHRADLLAKRVSK